MSISTHDRRSISAPLQVGDLKATMVFQGVILSDHLEKQEIMLTRGEAESLRDWLIKNLEASAPPVQKARCPLNYRSECNCRIRCGEVSQ